MLLTLENISKSFGGERIFENVCAEVNEGERIAIIGPNGAGKTTLLNIIAGTEEPDGGEVKRAACLQTGYLRQNGGLENGGTMESEMRSALKAVYDVEQAMQSTAEELSKISEHGSAAYRRLEEDYQRLEAQFLSLDGYNAGVKISTVLNGMGFSSFDRDTCVESMSGGERTRLMLSKLLVQEPNLLILDEATNHLDFKMLAWLEEYLLEYKGAIITVSHDRYFLDKVTRKTWEIENLELVEYPAPYGRYLLLRDERLERMEKEYERYQRETKRLQEYADKNMARASTSQSAKSRLRMIEHLDEVKKPVLPARPPKISFEGRLRPVSDILDVKGLELFVGEGASRRRLLKPCGIHVRRGEKIAIVGENGTGKSTLLRTLAGRRECESGSLEWGRNVRFSVFEQDSSELHGEKTALMELWDRFPSSNERELRTLLGSLQLVGEEAFKTVGVLSGGERARIKLAALMLEHGNVLLMDEPTNHLDIPAKEALERALIAFDGTVILVSHDRYLLSHLPSRILRLDNEELESFDGGFEQMQQQLKARQAEQRNAVVPVKAVSDEKNTFYRSKAQRSAEAAAKKRLSQLEEQILDTEDRISEAQKSLENPEIAADYEELSRLTALITELDADLTALYEELDSMV